jgi:hypothetical protein
MGEYLKPDDMFLHMCGFGYLGLHHKDRVASWSFDHGYTHENNILVSFE